MPPKFHFGLTPLLQHRRRIERDCERQFATCREEIREREDAMARLRDVLRTELLAPRAEGCLWYVDDSLAAHRDAASALKRRMESLRDELLAARRDRRVIEKLYERRRKAYEAELARYEEIELDEANAARRRTAKCP
ncbi:MAG: hypothetical protein JO030_07645 [Candidatus Eremiobacteraeota bacterium]|nr:hypothetical protein [Candidatus Eremiobacteraeota bacterium]